MRAGRHPTARHGVDRINHEINKSGPQQAQLSNRQLVTRPSFVIGR